MNVYDTVNKLAEEIKKSEEYVNFKLAKQAINLEPEYKIKIMRKLNIIKNASSRVVGGAFF